MESNKLIIDELVEEGKIAATDSKTVQILKGFANAYLGSDEEFAALSKERMNKCYYCPLIKYTNRDGKTGPVCDKSKSIILTIHQAKIVHEQMTKANAINRNYKEFELLATTEGIKGCGCWLEPKTKSPKSYCPAGKWLPVNMEDFSLKYRKTK